MMDLRFSRRDYEEYHLPGCNVVYFGSSTLTFRSNVSTPSSRNLLASHWFSAWLLVNREEPRPGSRVPGLRCFVVFLSPSTKVSG
jgi:hypothetical protein